MPRLRSTVRQWLNAGVERKLATGWRRFCRLALLAVPMVGVVIVSMLIPGLSGLFESEAESISRLESFVLCIVAMLTVPWLRFLKRRGGLRLTFYWIPCIWIAGVMILAFGAGVLVPSIWAG